MSAEFLLLSLFLFSMCIAGTVFWIWMLIECATKEANTGNTKVVWVLVIALAHVIGAAIYYFVRRPQRYAELHR